MEEVTSYKDINGNIWPTAAKCAEQDLALTLLNIPVADGSVITRETILNRKFLRNLKAFIILYEVHNPDVIEAQVPKPVDHAPLEHIKIIDKTGNLHDEVYYGRCSVCGKIDKPEHECRLADKPKCSHERKEQGFDGAPRCKDCGEQF